MAKSLTIFASVNPGFCGDFWFDLESLDENAIVKTHWFHGTWNQSECVFLIQPDLIRPLLEPFWSLKPRYVRPIEDLPMLFLKVKEGDNELACAVAGYGPQSFPELRHFFDLWDAVWGLVKRELEGVVPPAILNEK